MINTGLLQKIYLDDLSIPKNLGSNIGMLKPKFNITDITILYTKDGTFPIPNSSSSTFLATHLIPWDKPCTIRFMAYKSGYIISNLYTYTVGTTSSSKTVLFYPQEVINSKELDYDAYKERRNLKDKQYLLKDRKEIIGFPYYNDLTLDSFHTVQVDNYYKDRLDLVAYNEYGDSRLWWVIALYNEILNPLILPYGKKLIIPEYQDLYTNINSLFKRIYIYD